MEIKLNERQKQRIVALRRPVQAAQSVLDTYLLGLLDQHDTKDREVNVDLDAGVIRISDPPVVAE